MTPCDIWRINLSDKYLEVTKPAMHKPKCVGTCVTCEEYSRNCVIAPFLKVATTGRKWEADPLGCANSDECPVAEEQFHLHSRILFYGSRNIRHSRSHWKHQLQAFCTYRELEFMDDDFHFLLMGKI